jgi:cytidylate kinase
MIISITGDLGSGKSTVSNILKDRVHYGYVYTGKIQREIADKYQMSTLELNQYAETHPEIDAEIDATFKRLNDANNLIVDSRLAWFFIPKSFKVYLKTDVTVAADRISKDRQRKSETYITGEEAIRDIVARKESENKRYLELYGANCSDLTKFDMVIDCSYMKPEDVAAAILSVCMPFYTERD